MQIIEINDIKDGDQLIVELGKDYSFDEVNDAYKLLQKYFPNNEIIAIREDMVKSFTIIRKEDNQFA